MRRQTGQEIRECKRTNPTELPSKQGRPAENNRLTALFMVGPDGHNIQWR
jgi:hypothetical protein